MNKFPIALLALATLLGFGFSQSLDAQSPDPKVEVVGFSVAKPDKNDKFGGSAISGMAAGVRVYLKFSLKDTTIISIEESDLPVISDDRGKKLSEATPRFGSLKYLSRFSEDRADVTVPITGKTIPSDGTTKLTVKGTMKFNCSNSTKEETIEGELKTEAAFKIAGIDSKIQRLEKGFKDNSTRITFRASQNFDAIKAIIAINQDGQEKEGRSAGSSSFGFRDKKTYDRSFEFEFNQKQIAKFKIVYFDKIEVVSVPVDVTFGFDFK